MDVWTGESRQYTIIYINVCRTWRRAFREERAYTRPVLPNQCLSDAMSETAVCCLAVIYTERERDRERSIRSGAFMTETKCGIEAILRREKEREREREKEKVFDMHSSDASVRLSR